MYSLSGHDIFVFNFHRVLLTAIGMYVFSSWLLRRYSPVLLLIIAFAFEVFHMGAYPLLGIFRQPWGALAIESLQSVTYALFVPAGVNFMESHSPSPHLIASMQALFSLASYGFGLFFIATARVMHYFLREFFYSLFFFIFVHSCDNPAGLGAYQLPPCASGA